MIIDGNGTLSEQFIKMQDQLSPDYAIEIGAHAAEFSNHMTKNFNIPAIAFEAGKDIYEQYKDTVEKGVSYINCAISDIDGTATFFVHRSPTHGNNGIKRVNFMDSFEDSVVSCYKLDTYLKDYDFKNACLWVDVEGANKEVLSGATSILKRTSSIFIETEDIAAWKDQWLTEDVVTFLEAQGFLKVASENVYEMQKNIIFVKNK
jgi:FkbM family methyltransferase